MIHFDVVFTPDGAGNGTNGLKATWTCASGMFKIAWSNGFTDHMVLSADGKELSGTGGLGDAISASRK
jgi:hypothetical protein